MIKDAKPFLTSLESLRGLAALSVALFHSFHLMPVDGARVFDLRIGQLHGFSQTALRLIMVPFNGGAAVSLFFVLSGFVLYLSLRREQPLTGATTARFSLRRLLRIYPALAVNLLAFIAVWAALEKVAPGLGFSHFSAGQILENFSLHDTPISGVTWTLLVEILAIPGILLTALAAERWGTKGIAACTAGFFLFAVTPLNFKFDFVKYYYLFSAGMLVARLYADGRKMGQRPAQVLFALSLVCLLSARLIFGQFSKWAVLTEAISGTVLIATLVLGQQGRMHRLLTAATSRFLGRVSYSFYLYHPLFLTVASALLSQRYQDWMLQHPILASVVLAGVSIPPALAAGALSYRLIERPSMQLGRLF